MRKQMESNHFEDMQYSATKYRGAFLGKTILTHRNELQQDFEAAVAPTAYPVLALGPGLERVRPFLIPRVAAA
jgi:hypothetical protein